jgi:exoribonuclease R
MDQQHSSELPSIPQDVDPTEAVLRLLAMAEQFRVRRTPKYKLAIKCLFVRFFHRNNKSQYVCLGSSKDSLSKRAICKSRARNRKMLILLY